MSDSASDLNALTWRSFERALTARNRSPQTIATYAKVWRRLAAEHPAVDLTTLKSADLETHIGDLIEATSAGTAALHYRHLRAIYNWAVSEEIVDSSPMRKMTEPTGPDVPPEVLDDSKLIALLDACKGKTFNDRRNNALIRLWCEPGSPRLAEMAGIEMDHLDMRRDMVRLLGKGSKVRVIPFGAKTGTSLDRYLRLRSRRKDASSPSLWLGKFGALSSSGIAQILKRLSADAGIGHVHPHQLRHTSAHVWADSGGSESDAMELFGWSSPDMPRRYGRSARNARAQRASRRISPADRL